ncbi:hypothetical protein [Pandoraea sputorum]|uniref:hypothetical protein n=1 Tax=Pandoraea sputorum TaxID=93222 RepID=UPI002AF6B17D|nr:hypothetical protein [Pandoraea sputorum]
MTDELRLAWEPQNKTALPAIEERMLSYGVKEMTILGNGTLLAISGEEQVEADARRALNEAKFLTDFRTVTLKEGGYMVSLHEAVAVFVGDEEYTQQEQSIATRASELLFPGEHFFVPPGATHKDTLIGLYGRGKLQRDCYEFHFFKRISR